MIKLWERHLFIQLCQVFALFFCGFYFLYVLIDYSIHATHFAAIGLSLPKILQYYLCQLPRRCEILIAFGLLLATIKVTSALNNSHTLSALQAAGISLKRISTPFLIAGFLGMGLILLNHQVILPASGKLLNALQEEHAIEKSRRSRSTAIHVLPLPSNERLIYRSYQITGHSFSDVFWVKSLNEILHIKTLYPFTQPPQGEQVDILKRNALGELELVESHPTMRFETMQLSPQLLDQVICDPKLLSISALWQLKPIKQAIYTDRELEITTYLHYKLALSLIAPLVTVASFILCLSYERSRQFFIHYAVGLFALVAFLMIMDAAVTLGTSRLFAPWLVIWTPLLIPTLFWSWRWRKL